jgi:hypothetical protein
LESTKVFISLNNLCFVFKLATMMTLCRWIQTNVDAYKSCHFTYNRFRFCFCFCFVFVFGLKTFLRTKNGEDAFYGKYMFISENRIYCFMLLIRKIGNQILRTSFGNMTYQGYLNYATLLVHYYIIKLKIFTKQSIYHLELNVYLLRNGQFHINNDEKSQIQDCTLSLKPKQLL